MFPARLELHTTSNWHDQSIRRLATARVHASSCCAAAAAVCNAAAAANSLQVCGRHSGISACQVVQQATCAYYRLLR